MQDESQFHKDLVTARDAHGDNAKAIAKEINDKGHRMSNGRAWTQKALKAELMTLSGGSSEAEDATAVPHGEKVVGATEVPPPKKRTRTRKLAEGATKVPRPPVQKEPEVPSATIGPHNEPMEITEVADSATLVPQHLTNLEISYLKHFVAEQFAPGKETVTYTLPVELPEIPSRTSDSEQRLRLRPHVLKAAKEEAQRLFPGANITNVRLINFLLSWFGKVDPDGEPLRLPSGDQPDAEKSSQDA